MISHALGEVILVPSLKCNLSCYHCCRESGPDMRGVMSDRVIARLGDWFLGGPLSQPFSLLISGGEPFMLPLKFWKSLADIVPSGLELLSIITNGVWASNANARHNVIANVFPLLSRMAENISLEMSDDDYHRWERPSEAENGWHALKDEVENGFPSYRKGSEDGWFAIWGGDSFSFSLRRWDIDRPGSIMPIGRGKDAYMGPGSRHEDCGLEFNGGTYSDEGYVQEVIHQVTIWPNGDISACCSNSTAIGSIFDDDLTRTYTNQMLVHEYMRQRFPIGSESVTLDACAVCRTGLVPLQ